jgi:hypothetical protein
MWIRNSIIGKWRLNSGSDLSNRRRNIRKNWCISCKLIFQLHDGHMWYSRVWSVFGLGDDYPVANNRLQSPIIIHDNSTFSQIVNWYFHSRLLPNICQSNFSRIDTISSPTDQIGSLWSGFGNSCNVESIWEPSRAYPFEIQSNSNDSIRRIQGVVPVVCIVRRLFILRHQ